MPKVSIISGIYNCQNTLAMAADSMFTQSFSDWEWILCDDGSTDQTYEIAKRLAESDPRIRVMKNCENMGLAATLNECLQLAAGPYIARMDGDDLCPAERLEQEVDFLDENPEFAMVSGWMECFDEQGTYGLVKYPEKPVHADFVKRSRFCHAASMIRREVLESLGGYSITSDTYRVEDYDLWVRLYEAGYKGYNIQQILYYMRDDRNALKRRKFRYRLNESKVSYRVYKTCNLPVSNLKYAFFPVLKGLLPSFVYRILHRRKVRKALKEKR